MITKADIQELVTKMEQLDAAHKRLFADQKAKTDMACEIAQQMLDFMVKRDCVTTKAAIKTTTALIELRT